MAQICRIFKGFTGLGFNGVLGGIGTAWRLYLLLAGDTEGTDFLANRHRYFLFSLVASVRRCGAAGTRRATCKHGSKCQSQGGCAGSFNVLNVHNKFGLEIGVGRQQGCPMAGNRSDLAHVRML